MKKYSQIAALALCIGILGGCHTYSIVDFPGSHRHSDSDLNASVQTVLMNNPQLMGVPVTVQTLNGRVQLSGYVKTIRQSDVAADLASKVEGVSFVENNLIVRK